MSAPHQYRQPNGLSLSDEDSDSDLELSLQELDPAPSSAPASSSRSSRLSQANFDFARHIPLRNLRAIRRRRQLNTANKGDEDALDLLEDGNPSTVDSDISDQAHNDDAPLLPTHAIKPQVKRTGLSRVVSIFSSASTPQAAPDDEPDEEHDPSTNRSVLAGRRQPTKFPVNAISNSRYTAYDFLPRTLFNEFKFFINIYFLLVALSQVIPQLRIGYLYSYILPLAMVLLVTLSKEAYDDLVRRRRDAQANSESFVVLRFDPPSCSKASRRQQRAKRGNTNGHAAMTASSQRDDQLGSHDADNGVEEITKPAKDIRVGDIVKLGKDQRVPADMVILRCITSESTNSEVAANSTNEVFIRTDQLDGETDWKLRLASTLAQDIPLNQLNRLRIVAGKPDRKVNEFVGNIQLQNDDGGADDQSAKTAPLNVDNTTWASTVVASSCTLYGLVIYTGSQTRQAMSTTHSRSKIGLLELEVNSMTKILCALCLLTSLVLVLLGRVQNGEERGWYISTLRFLILFSTVIPISLRVNLDTGKIVYTWYIEHDNSIPDTLVRTSTIPEDLGRIEYLLSDKTGTLTQNEMELKKMHVGTVSYANEAMDEVASFIRQALSPPLDENTSTQTCYITPSSAIPVSVGPVTRTRREIGSRVRNLVFALALCHNVTPVLERNTDGSIHTSYQASSPDEIAIVKWTEAVGLKLMARDRTSMLLTSAETDKVAIHARILHVFPFTSEGKRMGIVVKFVTETDQSPTDIKDDSEIWFYQKGADTVMSSIVVTSDWLDEETGNMAREGLRTLVVGRKRLLPAQYLDFAKQYAQAALSIQGRDSALAECVKAFLEKDLELLGITGVEDKLQKDVKTSLELLRNAGIKIWMLTGDKIETARCIAISSKLVSRGQRVHTISKLTRRDAALDALQTLTSTPTAALLIDGESLSVLLHHHSHAFISIAATLSAVIACRVSPVQKAQLANLIKSFSGKRICCIGDGGNDVSMITAADVGVGIVGKEGRQASLAADFSITQFRHVVKLLVWHGRNSYKRSAKLAQFVIHRGVIMSVCQVLFSVASSFEPNALYRDWLMIGYATLYTFAPVLSLALDRDVDEPLSTLYPELYKELTSGLSLSYRTFFTWLLISIYQGVVIQALSQLLTPISLTTGFTRMVTLSYTALILNELIMVAIQVTTWHWIMGVALALTVAVYFASLPLLGDYMKLAYIKTPDFWWQLALCLALSLGPIWLGKIAARRLRPPTYRKVMHV